MTGLNKGRITNMPENFELPDITGLDAEALRGVEAQAVQAFTARYDAGATTPEDLQALQAIAETIETVRTAIVASEGEAPEPEPTPEPEAEPAPAETPPEPAPAEPAAPDAGEALGKFLEALAQRPVAQPAAGEGLALVPPVASPAPVAPAVAAPAPTPASIAAGALPPADAQLPIDRSPIVILASADIPGVPTGSKLEGWDGLVAAITSKASSIPDQRGSKYPVASIMKPRNPDRELDGLTEAQVFERLNDLSSPRYLEAQLSHTASGGWCAPNENIYEFACEVEAPPDAVDLPSFGSARRGGVHFPISPTFRDFKALTNNGLFTWTEADDIAAATGSPTKPCFKIPCVDFDDARLELEGLCVTAGNLTEQAYPELIRRYMSLVLTAHLHRLNTRKIQKMLALVDDSVTIAATFATASAVFDALLLQVQDLRDQFSMSQNALIETMMPRWARGPARADFARRQGLEDLTNVSDLDVQAFWQSAGVRIQFVSNWQEMGDPNSPALVWPTDLQFLMWLPGAYRLLDGPRLDIAVARDSTQNETNDYTVAFTEEAYQVFKPGCGSRLVTVPICASGAAGELVELTC